MAEAIFTVFNDDALIGTVVWVTVCPWSLAAFKSNSIIVDCHIAVFYQYIGTGINVDGIGAGSFDSFMGRQHAAVQIADMIAFVDVRCSEGGILKGYTGDRDVGTMGYVQKTRTLFIFVGAVRIPLTTQPEILPIALPVAVNDAFAGDGETIGVQDIDQCRKVGADLSFDACCAKREVGNIIAAFQTAVFGDIQVHGGGKVQCTGQVCAIAYNDYTAFFGRKINDMLDLSGLYRSVAAYAIVFENILFSQGFKGGNRGIEEPGIDSCSVREELTACIHRASLSGIIGDYKGPWVSGYRKRDQRVISLRMF